MKKSIRIVFIIVILIIVIIGVFLFINRKITIKESALKEIFKAGDFENVSITFVGVLGNEMDSMDEVDEKTTFLNIIKDEKIKPTSVNDKTVIGDSYRLVLKYNGKEYRLIISNDMITIKNRVYKTDNNIYKKLSTVFSNKYDIY